VSDQMIVHTSAGDLRGGRDSNGVAVWRGVAYAQQPVGELRFRAPQPVPAWTGVRAATRFGPVPPQVIGPLLTDTGGDQAPPDEGCLYLNVWSPARADASGRPVMVFIPGGAYVSGAGSFPLYDGKYLAEQGDVVVVTVNYRVGALGWLHFADLATANGNGENFDTNLGLRDHVAALEWVRDNIAAFGGDPGNVTIFGESAGGTSVLTLLTVPSAAGLFHRAIAQSPAVTAAYSRESGTRNAIRFLRVVGLSHTELSQLRTMPVALLAEATKKLLDLNAVDEPGSLPYGPVPDDDLLPMLPLDAVRAGKSAGVPLLIGTNRDESTLFARDKPSLLPTSSTLLERMFTLNDPASRQRVVAAYPGYPHRTATLAMATDWSFQVPSVWFADAYSQTAPTWMYRFDYVAPVLRATRSGATHGSEIIHVMHTYSTRIGKLLSAGAPKRVTVPMGERMQSAWVSMARDGSPGRPGGTPWPAYDDDLRLTRIFDRQDSVQADPARIARLAWNGFTGYR
jgi:para-nitrobenzyl esterase